MIKFFLGFIVGAGAMAFYSTPFGRSVLIAVAAQLQAAPVIVAAANSQNVIEVEPPAPPMSAETVQPAPVEKPAAEPAAASDADTEETFRRVMEIYEQDGKSQINEGEQIEQIKP